MQKRGRELHGGRERDRSVRTGGATKRASAFGLILTFAVTSWNVGVQADLYQQNRGLIPTVTLQATMTRSVPDSPLATTALNTIVEFDYALNADETRGLLAGVQDTRTAVDSPLASIN